MIEAAITVEQVADELQHMGEGEIRDPLRLLLWHRRLARRLRESATTIRETMSAEPRTTNPATTCPRERRRRMVMTRNGQRVAVESRGAS